MRKRLVLITAHFPQLSETFIVNKFLGLLDRGLDIYLVCSHFDKATWHKFPDLANHPGVKQRVRRCFPTQPKWLVPLLFLPALLRCLLWAPRHTLIYLKEGWTQFKWDIIRRFYLDSALIQLKPGILHFEFGSLAVGRTYLKELLHSQLTVSFRGYDLNFVGLDQPGYYDQVWKQADACHFLGRDLWQRAVRRGCPTEMQHRLIPPAIDLSLFQPEAERGPNSLGSPENPLRILSVGRLEWKKGYEFALQAIRMLVDQGTSVSYQVIGDGGHRDALYFTRHQLGLTESVEFLGSLPQHEVIQHLGEANAFLHPSLSEGFCNAVIEAQAMGVPVVCTDAGGLPENVANGVTGFVVPRRDPAAMAEKLALLAGDGALRLRMGKAGRVRVETHFQLDQQIKAFEAFYINLNNERMLEKNK
ncbi:MAG TPA: glycosyltransferase [Brevefilum sp.]|nr:glycosyltransferase [Brevefilum sp.]HPL69859.1 glycosyltransferase [Brevefilum sp.]